MSGSRPDRRVSGHPVIRVRVGLLCPGDRLVRQGLTVASVESGGIGAEGRPVVVVRHDGGGSNTWLADRRFAVVREEL